MSEVAIGATLAQARAEAGLSLESLAEITKVRASLLGQIEAGDFGQCGGTVYAKGHIRSIAHALGIDPEPLVRQLARSSGETPATVALISGGSDERLLRKAGPRKAPWGSMGVAAASIIAGLAVVSYLVGGTGGKSPAPAKAAEVLAPSPSAASPSPAAVVVPTKAAPTGVNVTVQVTGDSSWVGLYAPGSQTLAFQGILSAGSKKVFTAADSVHIRIGKPEAVTVSVNGRRVPAGTPGKPADVTFGPSGETSAHG